MTYDLDTRHDSRKSFYGKAVVSTNEHGDLILTSYSTQVAVIADGRAVVRGTYSATTLRHIKEFLKQNGFQADTAAQIMSYYGREA